MHWNGSDFTLKVGNAGNPADLLTVGTLQAKEFKLANAQVPRKDVASGAWRTLHEGQGQQSLTVSASGVASDVAAESRLFAYAMENGIQPYRLELGGGIALSGDFQIASYARQGASQQAEGFSITLASAGPIAFDAS